MNESLVRWLIIPGIIFILFSIGQYLRRKLVKPTYKNNIQTPGKFDHCLLTVIKVLTIIPVTLLLLGLITKESEMAIVSAILTSIFIGLIFFLQREYAMSYQENDDFFILKAKKKEVKVFYDNIIDWQAGMNEISVLDRTNDSQKYTKVNISMLKPEMLLKKIAEKTFSGHFAATDSSNIEDPYREQELINFYHFYGYDYLLEDYSRESKNR